ncbi:unnamed protein product [Aphanomyces euteiches]|uniref:ethanolamine kinase n=1 Tax=Aphanomyces euteiches TaxID=100861 RepID=A0A6G0WEH9_9STRA|nr:hypothetical protein Ae201684_015988 [Aphanomyces euteiches]KAH9088359.1 hypothetical protein Ae201684P_003053 [Aphanomyces euteiches]
MVVSREDEEAVRAIAREIPQWKGRIRNPEDVVVTDIAVVSANKILVAEFDGVKVLVKFPMENLFSMVFDLQEQKRVNDMVSQYRGDLGLNPRVLYVGDSCRVDEFVDCRTLKQADYADPSTMDQLATQLARLHNDKELKQRYIDLKGSVYTIAERLRGMQTILKRNLALRTANIDWQVPPEHQPLARRVNAAMEILADDTFFQRVLDRCFVVADPALLVFSHNDLSANNVLKLAHAVQIIDFDGSNLSYRGADIGYMAKNLEMHGMSMDNAALHRFVATYIDGCAAAGIHIEASQLFDEIARGKILALVFLMTMFAACDNWDVFHLTGFNFLATFPGFMDTIVEFANRRSAE